MARLGRFQRIRCDVEVNILEGGKVPQLIKVMRAPAISTVVIALTLLIGFPASAEGPAGIVLYCRWKESVYLLLADDHKGERGWSAFGGWADPGETRRATAARETEEETRGYFTRAWLGEQISGQKPVHSYGYSMYFVEVPFVPAQRVTNHPIGADGKDMAERGVYAWMPFTELEPVLGKERPSTGDLKVNPLYLPQGSKSGSFWGIWIRNMRDAMERGAFPWSGKGAKR